MLGWNADAIVGHAHRHLLHVSAAVVAGLVLSRNTNRAAAMLTRVSRVEDQIYQHLLNLIAVGVRQLQIAGELRLETDALETAVVSDQAQGLTYQFIEIKPSALRS